MDVSLTKSTSTLEEWFTKSICQNVPRSHHACHFQVVEIAEEGGEEEVEEGEEVGEYAGVGVDEGLVGCGTGPHLLEGELAKCAVVGWRHIIIC